jgi:hypothetical protein
MDFQACINISTDNFFDVHQLGDGKVDGLKDNKWIKIIYLFITINQNFIKIIKCT